MDVYKLYLNMVDLNTRAVMRYWDELLEIMDKASPSTSKMKAKK
jgi:hypothetical protein